MELWYNETIVVRYILWAALFKGFEGGAVFSAEKEGKFYLILDESTMASILDEEDLPDELVKIIEFDSVEERNEYIKSRGWA